MIVEDSRRIHEAIMFAARAHCNQKRKGTGLPYIYHPMEVMYILRDCDAPVDVQIAGVLHDTVEDTPVTIEEIKENFGDYIARLVGGHTEDKSKTWQERKLEDIAELEAGNIELKALVLADKLSNTRSLKDDIDEMGEEIWKKFNAPKEKQAWLSGEIVKVLAPLENEDKYRETYLEYRKLVEDIFGKDL